MVRIDGTYMEFYFCTHLHVYTQNHIFFLKFSDLFMFEHELGSHVLFMLLLVSVLILSFKWWRL